MDNNNKDDVNLNTVNVGDALALGDEHDVSLECRRWYTPLYALEQDKIIPR